MAYVLVASSGLQKGANLSWTHTFNLNNLCTGQEQNDSSNSPGTSDFADSSGTPKTLNRDVTSGADDTLTFAANYSLVVPSGFTSPLKGATVYEEWMACEWSGNATSSVLNTSNHSGGTNLASPQNSANITTGASAGLVMATVSINNGSAVQNATVAANFTDTYSTSHDGLDGNDSANDGGDCAYNVTSVASQTNLHATWTWGGGQSSHYANAISSYNAAATSIPNKIIAILQAVNRASTY